jgi:ABC-type spermidine/putrescine transport system permease subunit II
LVAYHALGIATAAGTGYSPFALIAGVLTWTVPIGTIIALAGFNKVHDETASAARNLGASSGRILQSLILPAARTEIAIAFLYAFAFALTDVYSNQALNGNRLYLLPTVMADRLRVNDWPFVAAASITLVIIEVVGLLAILAGLWAAARVGRSTC